MKPSHMTVGGVEMDDNSKHVTVDGEEVNLTPTEYDILKLFMQNQGTVFSPKDIYQTRLERLADRSRRYSCRTYTSFKREDRNKSCGTTVYKGGLGKGL